MNERFMFAPLLGFAVFISFFFCKLLEIAKLRWVVSLIFLFVIMAYSGKTASRNYAWKNNYTLFTTDVKTSTNSAKIRIGVAEVLLKSIDEKTSEENKNEKISEAITHLKKGLKIYPGFKAGWVYKGYAYVLRKDYESSRIALTEVLKIDSNDYDANYYLKNTALECYNQGNPEQAIRNYKTLLHFLPGNKEYQIMLSEIFSNNGKADSALMILKKLNIKYPNDSKVLNKMGEIYGRVLQDFQNSFKYLLMSYKANPNDIDNLRNLGTAYAMQSKFTEALKYLIEAEKIKPDDTDILNKLAITYKNMGDLPKFQEYTLRLQKLTSSQKN
jgi:tetratricopeptide (TPR) repeat protein